jgi:5-methylcytosine-specific restriction protein A
MKVEPGKIFNRRADLQDYYGCDLVKGISRSEPGGLIIAVADPASTKHNYIDRLLDDGKFEYYGQKAKIADPKANAPDPWHNNNPLIRDHVENEEEIVLFTKQGEQYQCEGTWTLESYRTGVIVEEGIEQDHIIFLLSPLVTKNIEISPSDVVSLLSLPPDILRKEAYEAANAAPGKKETTTNYYRRSAKIVAYALQRSKGCCETCNKKAPFDRPDGTFFLEVHHLFRLSDGGPDEPTKVAAVCPDCHRELHFGANGLKLNKRLRAKISEKEMALGDPGIACKPGDPGAQAPRLSCYD